MVTREIDADVPQDRSILRHIVRDLGQNVGVYATVLTPGTVRTGDPVTLD
jgi:MOSC domain-containing protein YiiM